MDLKKLWPKLKNLEKAKKQGGMGYATSKPPIIYDGTGEIIDLLGDGVTHAKISNAPIDLKSVTSVWVFNSLLGENESGKKYFQITDTGDGIEVLFLLSGTDYLPYILNFQTDITDEYGKLAIEQGVYVQDMTVGDVRDYVSRIEFEETIHPIDPKFIPDAVATKADIFGAMEASY